MIYQISIKCNFGEENRIIEIDLDNEQYNSLKICLVEKANKFIEIGDEILNVSTILGIKKLSEAVYHPASVQIKEPEFKPASEEVRKKTREWLEKKGIINKTNK